MGTSGIAFRSNACRVDCVPLSGFWAKLGVSRTPIRDALTRLEMEGLVKTVSKVGTFVNSLEIADVLDIIENPDRPSHRVVKSTQFQAKPMTLDEALLQLDLLDSSFYVFQNAKDGAINVVFRRDDGNYGLVEAHPTA